MHSWNTSTNNFGDFTKKTTEPPRQRLYLGVGLGGAGDVRDAEEGQHGLDFVCGSLRVFLEEQMENIRGVLLKSL